MLCFSIFFSIFSFPSKFFFFLQNDEDPYASVDDDDKSEKKKSELIRFKLKTLDIKEGSGDSTFYAKV